MTDGPNGPVIDNLADIRLELMQLNLYIRDLLAVSSRELPAPVVNVSPTPVIVESAPVSPVQPLNLDGLYARLDAVRGTPAGADQLDELRKLNKAIADLSIGMRAIAGSSISQGGVGGSVMTAGGTFPVKQAAEAEPFRVIVTSGAGTDTDNRTLTERMFAKAPKLNHSLYLDTADSTYIYIAEAPQGYGETELVFDGIRVTKDASGNPIGRVSVALDFAWASRGSATWL